MNHDYLIFFHWHLIIISYQRHSALRKVNEWNDPCKHWINLSLSPLDSSMWSETEAFQSVLIRPCVLVLLLQSSCTRWHPKLSHLISLSLTQVPFICSHSTPKQTVISVRFDGRSCLLAFTERAHEGLHFSCSMLVFLSWSYCGWRGESLPGAKGVVQGWELLKILEPAHQLIHRGGFWDWDTLAHIWLWWESISFIFHLCPFVGYLIWFCHFTFSLMSLPKSHSVVIGDVLVVCVIVWLSLKHVNRLCDSRKKKAQNSRKWDNWFQTFPKLELWHWVGF